MRPAYRLEADGKDVTAAIRDRLLSLRVTDRAGTESDSVELRLDDRGGLVDLPRPGAILRLWLGYAAPKDRLPAYMGRFAVDEVAGAAPPGELVIRCTAAELHGAFREPRSTSWHDTTLGGIVAAIAGRHGWTATVDTELAGRPVKHRDQAAESDAAFLTRLAADHDATAKPADGALVFVRRASGKTASGTPVPSLTVRRTEATSIRWTVARRGDYAAVAAGWTDHDGRTRRVETAGRGEPVLQLRHGYADRDSARAAAAARLAALRRGTLTATVDGPGRPDLWAERVILLAGFRAGVDGPYVVKTATHSLDSGGYRTSVDLETPGAGEEGNDDEP